MALEIVNAKETRLTDDELRMLAEIEEHSEIAKLDIPAFGGDVEKAYAAFKKSHEEFPKSEDESLVAKVNGRVVGFVGIHKLSGERGEMKHVGEVGIMVHPEYQRRGIGTKLLKAAVSLAKRRSFKRLEADTLANNKAMRRIAEKAGFNLEGIRRRRFKSNGGYLDETLQAILLAQNLAPAEHY